MPKIPNELNLIIRRNFVGGYCWGISILLDVLKSEINAREKTFIEDSIFLDRNEKHTGTSLHVSNYLSRQV